MKLYREFARKVQTRKGTMVDLPTLEVLCQSYNPGYSTLYMFDESAAAEIKERGHSGGMGEYKVYADWLAIDLDRGDLQLASVEEILRAKGLAYDVWESGGKGYHVILKHELKGSEHLPFSHKMFVKGLGIECDWTLYQHGRLFRLPGTVHEKTKRKKRLIKSVEGKMIDFPIVEKPEPTFDFLPNGGLNDLESGLFKLSNLAMSEPTPGNRHTAIFAVANDLHNAGLSYDTIKELLLAVNSTWQNGKGEDEVINAMAGGLKWRSRRSG